MQIDNNFIKEHDRLVRVIVNQYQTQGIDKQDLIQEGRLGLIEAAQHYDEKSGIQFTSYASWWIRKYVCKSIAQWLNIVPVPAREQYIKKKRSFDDVFAIEDGDVITFAEVITDGEYIEQTIIEQEEKEEQMQKIDLLLAQLKPKEQIVIRGLYGFDGDPLTLAMLAQQLHTSKDRIGKIHARALKNLKIFAYMKKK